MEGVKRDMTKLECIHIGKTLRGVTVLHDINLELESGKVYGFWGKNGCGKTMLMRVVGNLIRPTAGEIRINGMAVSRLQKYPVSIGALIENPAFLGECTGLENLRILASIRERISEEEIRESLAKVGLDPDDKRTYRKYSLGMKQRLGIACAVMERPEIVMLDEPINAIDEAGVSAVRSILEECRERGALVLIACHDKDEMKLLADEVFFMEEGTITRRWGKEEMNAW